jgi:signal transduction histidine kinase
MSRMMYVASSDLRYRRTMRDEEVDGELDLPIVHRLVKHHYTAVQLMAIDVAVVAFLTVLDELVLPQDTPRVSGTMWDVMGWAGFAVAAVATLLRRRYPRSVLTVIVGVYLVGNSLRADGPTPFYLLMALYSVIAVSSRRVASIVIGVVGLGVIASTIAAGGGAGQIIAGVIGGLALEGVGWLAGENTRASRVYAAQHAQRAADKAAAFEADRAEQVRRAVADERVEIARDLHDIVAHAMSVIAVRSGVARMVVDTQPDEAREALGIIETTTRRSLQEMRLLVGVLRSADDDHAELGPAPGLGDIGRLLADLAAAGVSVDVEIDGPPRPLPPAADLSAYRIVQEALTNVVRHAGPTHAKVAITYRPESVGIEVLDDGPDSDAPPNPALARQGTGHGLIGMRERALLFGGSLEAGPCASGYRVRAELHITDLESGEGSFVGGAG